jgi:hypothetical protein
MVLRHKRIASKDRQRSMDATIKAVETLPLSNAFFDNVFIYYKLRCYGVTL